SFQDAIDVTGRPPGKIDDVSPVRDQSAGGWKYSPVVNRRQFVLGGKPDDQLATYDRQCARCRNQAAIVRPRKGPNYAFKLGSVTRADRNQLQSERWCSCLDCAELTGSGRNIGIADNGYSGDSRCNLLEKLQPLRAQAVFETDKACGIPTRPRQAIDEARADWIDNAIENNWHSAGCF